MFNGFSTVGRSRPPFSLSGFELVKRDIMNTFFTKKGERVMLPNYGSDIWKMLMDPLDQITERDIIDDVINVISSEPRVRYQGSSVIIGDRSITVNIDVLYLADMTEEQLYIEFERNSREGF